VASQFYPGQDPDLALLSGSRAVCGYPMGGSGHEGSNEGKWLSQGFRQKKIKDDFKSAIKIFLFLHSRHCFTLLFLWLWR